MKSDLKYIIAFVVMILLLFLVSPAEAKDKLGMSMEDGSIITLTDELCEAKNPETGKPLPGFKARGILEGVLYPACWKNVNGFIWIIWFTPDGKEATGVSQHDPKHFSKIHAM